MEEKRVSYLNGEAGCQMRWGEGRAVSSACMSCLLTRHMSGCGSYLRADIREMLSLSHEHSCRLEKIAKRYLTNGKRGDIVYSTTNSQPKTHSQWPQDLDPNAIAKYKPDDC